MTAYLRLLPQPAAELLLPYLPLFDFPESKWNPFTAYLARENFPTAGIWIPGLVEAEALAQTRAMCGIQCGFHLKTTAMSRLVEGATDTQDHLRLAT